METDPPYEGGSTFKKIFYSSGKWCCIGLTIFTTCFLLYINFTGGNSDEFQLNEGFLSVTPLADRPTNATLYANGTLILNAGNEIMIIEQNETLAIKSEVNELLGIFKKPRGIMAKVRNATFWK